MATASILGTGHYLPERVVTNAELLEESGLRLKSFFITRHIGIQARRFAAAGQCTSDLAAEAARQALRNARVDPVELKRIIVATVSGDYPSPATACRVQAILGARHAAAVDLVGACSGFVFALDFASRCVRTGEGPVLVIGADIRSRQLNLTDARTAFLYGDGAGAVVVGAEQRSSHGILDSVLMSDGRGVEEVFIPAGGSKEPLTAAGLLQKRNTITMPNGQRVARQALDGFAGLTDALLARTQRKLEEIDFFILHQPNYFLTLAVLKRLGIPEDRTWLNFPSYGNTTSASVPISLSEAVANGKIRDGSLVFLGAVGAGLSAGALLIRWGRP